jgi:hypothetical protein
MYKFIQRKKKVLLAVFGVLLMIVFIIPSTAKYANDRESTTVGKVGDEKITAGELSGAANDLRSLSQALFKGEINVEPKARQLLQFSQMSGGMSPSRIMAFTQMSWSDPDVQLVAALLMLREQPLAFAILQKEAKLAGVEAPESDVDKYLVSTNPNQTTVDEELKQPLRRLLTVLMNFNRVNGQSKITLPQVMNDVASRQEAMLNIVEFKAEDFLSTIPNPPDAEIETAWRKYAAEPADSARTAMSAVRFGYLIPDKAKLQYVKLPIDRLRNAALHMLSNDDLVAIDRIAIDHYSKNPDEFSTPAFNERDLIAGPFTKPSTQATSKPAAKPFREVQDDLRRKVLAGTLQIDPSLPADYREGLEAVKKKYLASIDQLRQKYVDRLTADFKKHEKGEPIMLEAVPASRSTTQPSTQPATQPEAEPTTAPVAQPAPPFESVAYLEAVFQNVLDVATKGQSLTPPVKKKGKIDPHAVASESDELEPLGRSLEDKWYTKSDLNQVPGIGSAAAGGDRFTDVAMRTIPTSATQPSTQPTTGGATQPTTAPTTMVSTTTGPTTNPSTNPTTNPSTQPAGPVVGPLGKSAWAMYQPSPLLKTGAEDDAYVFRLTGFEPQRVPPLDEVREKIIADMKLNQAFIAAHNKAESVYKEVLKQKESSPNKGLEDMAKLMSEKVIVAGPINREFPIVLGYEDLTERAAVEVLVRTTTGFWNGPQLISPGLIHEATTKNPHPLQVIDLKPAKRTVIVEIRNIVRGWSKEEDYAKQREQLQNLMFASQFLEPPRAQKEPRSIADVWFNPDEVKHRTGYQATGSGG